MADAGIETQAGHDFPGVVGKQRHNLAIGFALVERGGAAQDAIVGDIAENLVGRAIGDQIERARLACDFDQHVAVDGKVGRTIGRAIDPELDVVRAKTRGELAGDTQIALARVEVRFDGAILARHDQPRRGGRSVDLNAVGPGDCIAEPCDRVGRRAECGSRCGEEPVGKGSGIGRVGGRVKGVEAVLALGVTKVGGNLPAAEIAFILQADVAEADVATVGQVALQCPDAVVAVAIADVEAAQRRRVHGAGEEIDEGIERNRRVAWVGKRDRQIKGVLVVEIGARQPDETIVQFVLDVGADLAALVVGIAVVAVSIMLAQEAPDRIICSLGDLPGLNKVEPIKSRVAKRHLRHAARNFAAADSDIVGDRRSAARIDRRRATTDHFDALGHQIEAVHAVAGIEEHAVDFVEQRQAVLLEDQIATIGRDAAHAGDVLHLAAGCLDMDAWHDAEKFGEVLRRDPAHFLLRERVDRKGRIEAALRAG